MDAYRVGQLFPHEEYCTGREMNVAIPTEGFFHILMSLKKISRKERKLFTRGTITASLFEQRDIPFLVVDFGENFSIDISFDISKFDDETRRIWLASETNAIAIFLVEATTGILEDIRLIGVGFDPELRAICARQKRPEGHCRACSPHSLSVFNKGYGPACYRKNSLQTAFLAGWVLLLSSVSILGS